MSTGTSTSGGRDLLLHPADAVCKPAQAGAREKPRQTGGQDANRKRNNRLSLGVTLPLGDFCWHICCVPRPG